MKKSEAYHLALVAVVTTPTISPERKLEVMKILMDAEDLALFCEKQGEEKAAANDIEED